MHEYSIISELIARVDDEARKHGADRVHRVSVRLGELAGVNRHLLETAFSVFRERTICEHAELAIEAVPGDALLLQRIEMEVSDV